MSLLAKVIGGGTGIILALTIMASDAIAQQVVCNKRTVFVEKLAKDYKEFPVHMGMITDGNVMEVFASEEGSWTAIYTRPNGVSCVIATGQSWEKTIPRKNKLLKPSGLKV